MNIGIDEVGRGAFAGPVYVCAFGTTLIEKELLSLFPHKKLKDSKKLKKGERETLYKKLVVLKKEGGVYFAIGKASASYIDKHGLTKAILVSLTKALLSLQKQTRTPENKVTVFLDGGLSAPKTYKHQETIIKGDEKIAVIACASVIAKVLRDAHMTKLAKTYPIYDFAHNVGYGTEKHRKALKKYGVTREHRLLFLRNILDKKL